MKAIPTLLIVAVTMAGAVSAQTTSPSTASLTGAWQLKSIETIRASEPM